jgi:carboxypeptidase Taq
MPKSLEQRLIELKRRLVEINDLKSAGAILSWDQATYMPSGGVGADIRRLISELRPELLKLTNARQPERSTGGRNLELVSGRGAVAAQFWYPG